MNVTRATLVAVLLAIGLGPVVPAGAVAPVAAKAVVKAKPKPRKRVVRTTVTTRKPAVPAPAPVTTAPPEDPDDWKVTVSIKYGPGK